jgi:hypothetical protein
MFRCGQFGFAGDEDIGAAKETRVGGAAVLSGLGLAKATVAKKATKMVEKCMMMVERMTSVIMDLGCFSVGLIRRVDRSLYGSLVAGPNIATMSAYKFL